MTQSTNLKLDLLSATDLFDTDKIKSNFEKIDNTVLIPTKIIDNCVTDNSLLPLSAKQGKLLQDQITKLNGDLFSNLIKVTDVHNIGKSCLFRAEYGSANTPTSDLGYIGISVCVGSNWKFVICSPYSGGKLFFDSVNTSGLWIGWKEISFK